jgi:hypothetical protein
MVRVFFCILYFNGVGTLWFLRFMQKATYWKSKEDVAFFSFHIISLTFVFVAHILQMFWRRQHLLLCRKWGHRKLHQTQSTSLKKT